MAMKREEQRADEMAWPEGHQWLSHLQSLHCYSGLSALNLRPVLLAFATCHEDYLKSLARICLLAMKTIL
jgi:hypothetical protein